MLFWLENRSIGNRRAHTFLALHNAIQRKSDRTYPHYEIICSCGLKEMTFRLISNRKNVVLSNTPLAQEKNSVRKRPQNFLARALNTVVWALLACAGAAVGTNLTGWQAIWNLKPEVVRSSTSKCVKTIRFAKATGCIQFRRAQSSI